MAQKITVSVIFILFALLCVQAKQLPSFIREKRTIKTKSPAKLKESIGCELEQVLTLSSRLIASLADGQQMIIVKMHDLIAPEKGDMFANAKIKELENYLHRLQTMHQELTRTEQSIKKELANFSKNFNT